jgi:Icc protein
MTKIVLQLTDIHLFANPAETIRGLNTDHTLHEVLQQVRQDPEFQQLNLVLLTGDLAQYGAPEAYQRLIKHIAFFKCPILWTPGNHDELLPMKLKFHGHLTDQHHFILGPWQIIALNSLLPGDIGGKLSELELAKLQYLLEKNPTKPTLIAMHHPYAEYDSHEPHPKLLQNASAFLTILKPYSNIKAIVTGHVHHASDQQIEGQRQITTPSTCFQFSIKNHEVVVDPSQNPGYRWLMLHDNGTLDTKVRYLP